MSLRQKIEQPDWLIVPISVASLVLMVALMKPFFAQAYWVGSYYDGYIYGLLIRAYQHANELWQTDSYFPGWGPPYFFYLCAKIANLFGTTNLGDIQLVAHVAVMALFAPLTYFLYRTFASQPLAAWATIATLVSLACGPLLTRITMFDKPHELLSLIALPSLLGYLAYIYGNPLPAWRRALHGAIVGLAFGIYTPFVVVPVLAIALYVIAVKFFRRDAAPSWRRIADPAFLFAGFVTALPYLLVLLDGYRSFGGIMPTRAWHDFEYAFDYFRPYFINTLMFTAVAIPLIVLWRRPSGSWNCLVDALIVMIALGFLSHALFVYLHMQGIHIVGAKKYLISVPAYLGLLLVFLLRGQIEKFPAAAHYTGLLLILVALWFGFTYISRESVSISKFYFRDLYEASRVLDEYRAARGETEPVYYLGVKRASMINYYTKTPLTNYLLANGNYAPPFVDSKERALSLAAAADKDTDTLWRYLNERKIRYLLVYDNNAQIKSTYNEADEMYIEVTTDLNAKAQIDWMVADGKIKALHSARSGIVIYEVQPN